MDIAIVTGSAGLIGAEAVRFLSEKNFKIIGIDNDMRKEFFGEEASTAWQRKKLGGQGPAKLRFTHPLNLVFVAYNVTYWIPIVLPFTPIMDYRTGFIAVFVVIIIRAAANLYRNNVLTLEQAEIFPFRIP